MPAATLQPLKQRQTVLIILGLLMLTGLAFSPVWNAGFINLDDSDYIFENPPVLAGLNSQGVAWAFTTGHAANWHPLTWLSHMLDIELFGLKPQAHHMVSVAYHAVNATLLFVFLSRSTKTIWLSALVAALFALHPQRAESVAWISERKDVLSTFFGLLTLMAYARYASESKVQSLKSKVWYALALGLFACGLMSKPMLVTWPLLMLLFDYWPLNRMRSAECGMRNGGKLKTSTPHPTLSPAEAERAGPVPGRGQLATCNLQLSRLRGLLVEKIPFFVLALASSVITFLVQRQGGAVASITHLPLPDRLANATLSYVRYLGKTFWPTDLAVYYPAPGHWSAAAISGAVAILLLITFLCLRFGRERKYLLVGWAWFVITLIPVIGIVQVGGQAMADRYTYIPAMGLLILVVWGGAELLAKQRALGVVMAIATLTLSGVLLQRYVTLWKSSEPLFAHAIAVTPPNYIARFCLANALIEQGRLPEGMEQLKACLEINPTFAKAYGKLAYLTASNGLFRDAIAQYQKTLALRPDLPEALNNLAWLLATCADATIRDGKQAVALATRACELTRYQKTIYIGTLAAAYAEAGQFAAAIRTGLQAQANAQNWGETELAKRNAQLVEEYRAGRPYREKALDP